MKEKQTKKDHRDIGRELDLFRFHDIAPGAPFWHPNGMIVFKELERYLRDLLEDSYQEIATPTMVKKEVFERSGHWEYYRENMFYFDIDGETYVLKPMNCPESTYVFGSTVRSWRDLPIRLSEIGRLYRNELSGVLGGLFRVRQITMDDAHIYCREDQIEDEVVAILDLLEKFYERVFHFPVSYRLATRPKKAFGSKTAWDSAEQALTKALKHKELRYDVDEGAGAFYGPKIEVHITDALGRDWQLGTAQLDLFIAKNFNAAYVNAEGEKKYPVVIHRAIFGSFERFIGVLLEHTQGALPFWLSPVQVAVLPLNEHAISYCLSVVRKIKKAGARVLIDKRNETIGKKIRESELQKIPYILVVGEKEKAENTIAVRERHKGDRGSATVAQFIAEIKKQSRI